MISQQIIDEVLASGGNETSSTLRICAHFKKDYPAEDNAAFLRQEYGTGGRGFYIAGGPVSEWFDETGIQIARGKSSVEATERDRTLITWEQASKRIRELLDLGRYLSQDELDQVDEYEREMLADRLWKLRGDCSGTFFLGEDLFGHGYPADVQLIAEYLRDPQQREEAVMGLSDLTARYEQDHSVLRSHYIQPKAILRQLRGLQREPLLFPAGPLAQLPSSYFITRDEIDQMLCSGSHIEDGKYRIYANFLAHEGRHERAVFLKEEYGTGGYGRGCYDESNDAKGIVFSRGAIGAPYEKILLTWSKAEQRISQLIEADRYMSQGELNQIPDYERRVLAGELFYFFSHSENENKPYSRDADYYKAVPSLIKQLRDPERVKQLVEQMAKLLPSAGKDARYQGSDEKAYRNLLAYRDGSFSLFGKMPEEIKALQAAQPAQTYVIPALSDHSDTLAGRLNDFYLSYDPYDYQNHMEVGETQEDVIAQLETLIVDPIQRKEQIYDLQNLLQKTDPDAGDRAAVNNLIEDLLSMGISYDLPLGTEVHIGKDVFEVAALGEDAVQLRDAQFPLFLSEMPRQEFERKLRENPYNDHLISKKQPIPAAAPKESQETPALAPDDAPQVLAAYREYQACKRDNPGYLVAVQVDGHYEIYGEDAKTAAPLWHSEMMERRLDGLQTAISGFDPASQWAYYFHQLWQRGLDILFVGLEEGKEDYTTVKQLSGKDFIPEGCELQIDKRRYRVEKVDFPTSSVSLQDLTFAEGTGFPIFRKETVEFVRSYVEEQWNDIIAAALEHQPLTRASDMLIIGAGEPTHEVDVAVSEETWETIQKAIPETEPALKPAWEKPKRRQVSPKMLYPELPAEEHYNFRISDDTLGEGGPKAKYAANISTIRLLQELDADHRLATPEEQEVLARYVGWGGISQAFDESSGIWAAENQELRQLLPPDEYESAKESSLNAFYTSPVVIRAIYEALAQMGFRTGNLLEPSCGIGNFMGLLPEGMADSKFYGVELDSTTGRIARQLYQKNSISIQGFEDAEFPDSFFDAAIGNVPFGQYKVADKRYDKHNFLIHDFFFAKTLDEIRPGGLIAFITSKGTMDKENTAVRRYIAQRAELLGAIRLPNNAFLRSAGTQVTSDILFLQKRDRVTDLEPDWVHLDLDQSGLKTNSYFVTHPDMILGEMTTESTQYGYDTTCRPIPGAILKDQLWTAIGNIHGEITEYDREETVEDTEESILADPTVRNFSLTAVEGKLYFRENSIMKPVTVSETAENRIRGLMGLRDCVRSLIEYQTEDYSTEVIQAEQQRLNTLYDEFTRKYDHISSRGNSLAFSDDSSYCLLCSLEVFDDEGNFKRKADMFTKRTIRQRKVITSVDTASEALTVSLAEKARVDMEYMAQLTGETSEEIEADLAGVIFRVPSTKDESGRPRFEAADEYLSGNVREKLAEARTAAADNPAFLPNVKALEAVQPTPLTASEISVRLGASWIPSDVVKDFIVDFLSPSPYARNRLKVLYSGYTAQWVVEGKNNDSGNIKVESTYGTKTINAYKILEDTLNLRDVRIFDYVTDENGNQKPVFNKKETTIAQQKQDLIKEGFADWIWQNPERRDRLCKLYNEKYNSVRPREYDGQHITFPGINPEISLYPHQVNAIAHILYGGNTLLAHVVGAGKTFEMVAAAMESKRLGLCQKSLFVVPNHLTEQWASDFLQLYPAANVLVARKKDFETKNRKKFCGRIATGDYDAIIIGHSQFEKIPMSIERQRRLLENEVDEITNGIADLKSSHSENFTVKQLAKTKKTLEVKLKKLNDQSRKDDVVTFEELGVDRIFVDEAHNYKNLFCYTKMRNVGGISQTEAQKSSDLFAKCRYLDELTAGRGVVFATGTPISNSMVEMYTMQRYLQYEMLRHNGLQNFDAWASTFGETVTAIELAPEGTGYRAKTRFSRFYNLPELMCMFREVADIQTADMLNLPVPKVNYHAIALKPSDQQRDIVVSLSERAEQVRNRMVEPNEDNMLLITNDGRKLALDQRLVNPLLPDNEGGKLSACADTIFEIWQRTKAQSSTQLVFSDLSTPKNDGSFNVYDDIRQKLLDKGIPEQEIAFIHDANTETKKAELFGKVRSGKVRVLMGSTSKMGAGTNVQTKLIASHDLDCPWRPSDLEQRAGRIIRQGNENPEVDIYRYVTENTFDAYLYQLVENKQKFIAQIMTSKSPVRSCEDIDESALSYAEIKALAAGDPHIKEKMDLDIAVARLKVLKSSYLSQKYALEDQILKQFPREIAECKGRIRGYAEDIRQLSENTHPSEDGFSPMVIQGRIYSEKESAGKVLLTACKAMKAPEAVSIGTYRGFDMELSFDSLTKEFRLALKHTLRHTVELGDSVYGNITRLDNVLADFPDDLQAARDRLENAEVQWETAKAEVRKPFTQETELKIKVARLAELDAELNLGREETADSEQTEEECEP